jgi:hypothetical protein
MLEDVATDLFLLRACLERSPSGDLGLEVVIGRGQDADEVVDPRPDVVVSFMPRALRGVKRVVVRRLGLEDPLLDTDVARHFVPLREQGVRREESREAAVPVRDGVDRQEVEDERADEKDGVRCFGTSRVTVALEEVAKQRFGLLRRRRGEEHPSLAALVRDDEVLVGLQAPAVTIDMTEEQAVEVKHVRHGDDFLFGRRRDLIDRITVAGELALVPVPIPSLVPGRRDQTGDPTGVYGDAFDGVRGGDGLDARRREWRPQGDSNP